MAPNPFRFYVGSIGDLRTVDQVSLLLHSRTPMLNRAGSWKATVAPNEPHLDLLLNEWESVVYLDNRGTVEWAGVVEKPHWENGTWTLEGPELIGYADRVFLHFDQPNTGVDQLLLLQLIAGAMPDLQADLQLHNHSAGALRDLTWTAAQMPTVLSQLEKLSAFDNAFDFHMSYQWDGDLIRRYLDVWFPNRGTMRPLVWEHGKAITVKTVQRDGSQRAKRVWAVGSGSGGGAIPQFATGPLAGPLLELVIPQKDTHDASSLLAAAKAGAVRNAKAHQTLTVDIDVTHPDAQLDRWDIGDMMIARADDTALHIDPVEYRLTAATYTIGPDGTVAVSGATLLEQILPGAPIFAPDGLRDLVTLAKRVRTIELNSSSDAAATLPSAIAVWSAPGKVQATVGQIEQPITRAGLLTEVIVRLGTAAAGPGCTVDVKCNGTSIFTSTPRPTVVAGDTTASAVPDIQAVAVGDFLTVDVTTPDGWDISVVVTAT